MLATVCSAAVNGIESYPVEVEINAGYGDTIIVIVGLPDAAVKESRDSAGFTTWLVYSAGTNQFTLWHPATHPQPKPTTVTVECVGELRINFSGEHEPHLLRIHSAMAPVQVKLDGQEMAGVAWPYAAAREMLLIQTREYQQGRYEIAWH
jgi:hypothetical protein